MSRWNRKAMLLGKGWQIKQQYPQKEQQQKRDRGCKFLRLVVGIVAFSAAGLLIANPSLHSYRTLSVESHSEFTPQLSFTGPGTFTNPNDPNDVQVNLFFDGSVNPSASLEEGHSQEWQGTQTVKAGQEFTFVLMHFMTGVAGFTGCPEGIIAWFESVDTKAVFAIPAFYKNESKDLVRGSKTSNDLIFRTSIVDPGEYRVHLLGFQSIEIEEGSHGTVGDVRPITGSPWTLEVMPKTKDEKAGDHGDDKAEETTAKTTITDHRALSHTQINVPTRVCDSSDLESSGKGRWVECAAAGIAPEQCLFDGWVYLPYNCQWDLVNTIDALEISKEIADARSGKPVWIVFTGSSIERGTAHALVDMLGGIGNYDPTTGDIDGSVADLLFKGIENVIGQGSMTKCWGWYDVQIGNIRVSYQDLRSVYMYDQAFKEESLNRWSEILNEGPDLIVHGDISSWSYNAPYLVEMIKAVADTPSFDGVIAIAPQKDRMLNGGIGGSYICLPDEMEKMSDVAVEAAPSVVEGVRATFNKFLEDCGDSCSTVADKFVVADEAMMSWSFFFDTERLMSETQFSQHYHAYTTEAVPRPPCGSVHSDRRYVVGSVTEMAAHMYLTTTLSRLVGRMGKDFEQRKRSSCKLKQNEAFPHFETDMAKTHRFKACFSCPVSSCCAFPNTGWLPARTPKQSLSDPELKNKKSFGDGDNEFCYDGTA